jgi:hypothetical protein
MIDFSKGGEITMGRKQLVSFIACGMAVIFSVTSVVQVAGAGEAKPSLLAPRVDAEHDDAQKKIGESMSAETKKKADAAVKEVGGLLVNMQSRIDVQKKSVEIINKHFKKMKKEHTRLVAFYIMTEILRHLYKEHQALNKRTIVARKALKNYRMYLKKLRKRQRAAKNKAETAVQEKETVETADTAVTTETSAFFMVKMPIIKPIVLKEAEEVPIDEVAGEIAKAKVMEGAIAIATKDAAKAEKAMLIYSKQLLRLLKKGFKAQSKALENVQQF